MNNNEEIYKSIQHHQELLKQNIENSFFKSENNEDIKKSSHKPQKYNNGSVLGKTKSGKEVFSRLKATSKYYKDFTPEEHKEAADMHHEKSQQDGSYKPLQRFLVNDHVNMCEMKGGKIEKSTHAGHVENIQEWIGNDHSPETINKVVEQIPKLKINPESPEEESDMIYDHIDKHSKNISKMTGVPQEHVKDIMWAHHMSRNTNLNRTNKSVYNDFEKATRDDISHLEQGKDGTYTRHHKDGSSTAFKTGDTVHFEHKGKMVQGEVKKLFQHPVTDKFGSAHIHDKSGTKYSKSLRALEHFKGDSDKSVAPPTKESTMKKPYSTTEDEGSFSRVYNAPPFKSTSKDFAGSVKEHTKVHGMSDEQHTKFMDSHAGKTLANVYKNGTKDNFDKVAPPIIKQYKNSMAKSLDEVEDMLNKSLDVLEKSEWYDAMKHGNYQQGQLAKVDTEGNTHIYDPKTKKLYKQSGSGRQSMSEHISDNVKSTQHADKLIGSKPTKRLTQDEEENELNKGMGINKSSIKNENHPYSLEWEHDSTGDSKHIGHFESPEHAEKWIEKDDAKSRPSVPEGADVFLTHKASGKRQFYTGEWENVNYK